MPFVVGETIGPYRIVEQLGQGGMATVFKAYHAALDRYVAIKALHPAFLEDKTFLARFQREARVVARLEHSHIVPVYDFAEYEGRPYLVMKFIEGETLKARLSRGALQPEEILSIIESVGAALSYAHQQGILHRDVKPSNVILGPDGHIYLADFGLARIATAGESTLSSDMVLGTPQYISPEQALGKKELDEGTDIYSFGVLIYEMVVGKAPFSGDTPYAVIHDHIYTPLPLPRQLNPKVSPQIERVLLKALAKERSDRHEDVATLVSACRKAIGDSEPFTADTRLQSSSEPGSLTQVSTSPPAQPEAPRTPTARRKPSWLPWVIGASVMVVGCILIMVILKPVARLRAWFSRETAVTQVSAVTQAPETEILPSSTPPQETPPASHPTPEREILPLPEGVLFVADFNDGNLPPGWVTEGTWAVQENVLCGRTAGMTGLHEGSEWDNYQVDFSFILESGALAVNIYHLPDPLRSYRIEIAPDEAAIIKRYGERVQELARRPYHLEINQWQQAHIYAYNGIIQVSINGQMIIDVVDDQQPLSNGAISFELPESSAACLDTLHVAKAPPPQMHPSPSTEEPSGPSPETDTLYANNFNAPLGPEWLLGEGWELRDGQLCGAGRDYAVLREPLFTDFAVNFHFMLEGNLRLNFRSQANPWRRYQLLFSLQGQQIALQKQINDSETSDVLATADFPLQAGQWYEAHVSARQGMLLVLINQEQAMLFVDRKALEAGVIAFELLDSSACIDDLVVIPPLLERP